jgi:hypothetical protein
VGTQGRLQLGRGDPLDDRRALAAGNDQGVEAFEICRGADLRGFGAKPAQRFSVCFETTLQG